MKLSKSALVLLLVLAFTFAFTGVASAQTSTKHHKHHHKKIEAFTTNCGIKVSPSTFKETTAGSGSFTVQMSDCPPVSAFLLTSTQTLATCTVSFTPSVIVTDLEGRGNASASFNGSNCVPGYYLVIASESIPPYVQAHAAYGVDAP